MCQVKLRGHISRLAMSRQVNFDFSGPDEGCYPESKPTLEKGIDSLLLELQGILHRSDR